MQRAEGPEAFEAGYNTMRSIHGDNARKLEYIEELYEDDNKAFFKSMLPYTNGVLVDMCETLFNALKVWVFGSCRNNRITLLMAVVRIISGTYSLIMRSFLRPVSYSINKTKTGNKYVSAMFRVFCTKLTTRAVMDMFKSLESVWGTHDVTSQMNQSHRLISNHGDVFTVDSEFMCTCANGQSCWQQTHTGLLCAHALQACVHRMQEAPCREVRDSIIDSALKVCDTNWLRQTYSGMEVPTNLPRPIRIQYNPTAEPVDYRWQEYHRRFKEAALFLSPAVLERHLHSLELLVLSGGNDCNLSPATPSSDASVSSVNVTSVDNQWASDTGLTSADDIDTGSVSETVNTSPRIQVSNPPLRKRVRKANTGMESDDDM